MECHGSCGVVRVGGDVLDRKRGLPETRASSVRRCLPMAHLLWLMCLSWRRDWRSANYAISAETCVWQIVVSGVVVVSLLSSFQEKDEICLRKVRKLQL